MAKLGAGQSDGRIYAFVKHSTLRMLEIKNLAIADINLATGPRIRSMMIDDDIMTAVKLLLLSTT